MSLRSPSRYTVLAGLFLLGSVALAIAISFWLANGIEFFKDTYTFTVRFPLTQNTQGLKPDSPVNLGGQKIGKVDNISFDPTQRYVLARVRLDATHPVFPDAVITLEKPLLGSQALINISSVGTTGTASDPKKPLTSADFIDAGQSPGMLAQFGLSPDDIKKLLASTQETVSNINELIKSNRPKIDAIFDEVHSITRPTAERWPEWMKQFDNTFTNVSNFSNDLAPLARNFNDKVDNFGKLLGNVNSVIEENRDNIRQITSDGRAITSDIRSTTLPAVNNIVQGIEAWCATELPELRRSVANLRIVTDQSKRAITEIRAQPWRLFFQPSKKEMETDVLFWAANAYADAVSDLRSATEGMQNTIALANSSKPGTGPDPKLLDAQYKLLLDSMQSYKKAEQDLLDVLILRSGGKLPAANAAPNLDAAKEQLKEAKQQSK